MDEMKPPHEIDVAMREVAALRDKALGKVPALSSSRRAGLAASLVREFPVETALLEVAATRDKAIHSSSAKMPAVVESILNRQLVDAEKTNVRGAVRLWLNRLRLPLAAAVIIWALFSAVFARFGGWEAVSKRNAGNFAPVSPIDRIGNEAQFAFREFAGGRMEPFARKLALTSFNLNTNEPASLQLSFLANSIRFADRNETPVGLRLDLPGRVALTEDGLARTP